MTALTDFLLARIDEDERIAHLVAANSPTNQTRFGMWAAAFALDSRRIIVAVDYQRVLADCAAKRRIVEAYLKIAAHGWPLYAAADDLDTTIRELASVYADHNEYRSAWRR